MIYIVTKICTATRTKTMGTVYMINNVLNKFRLKKQNK